MGWAKNDIQPISRRTTYPHPPPSTVLDLCLGLKVWTGRVEAGVEAVHLPPCTSQIHTVADRRHREHTHQPTRRGGAARRGGSER